MMQLEASWMEQSATQEVREVFLKEHFTSKSTKFVVVHSQPQRSCLKAQIKTKNAFGLRWSVPLMHLKHLFNVPVFPRSHKSLFTWTCCLFLSLSAPSCVRTRELQRSAVVRWNYCYSVIYVVFFLKRFYLFSFILNSFFFTPQLCWTNKVILEFVVRDIYISAASEHVRNSWKNSKLIYLNFFFISLKRPHLITVIMFRYWDHSGPCDFLFTN